MIRRGYVLLDRDGTVIVDKHYLANPDDVELLPGAAEGLRLLYQSGLGLIVISNQSGIGRGYYTEDALARVQRRMQELLEAEGVRLDAIYSCPHAPGAQCGCRKPEPALALDAARDFGFDLHDAWIVGDKDCDMELADRCGARSIWVGDGSDNLLSAARYILMESRFNPVDLVEGASERLRAHVRASIATKEALLAKCEPDLLESARVVTRALASGRKVMLCGNGGSAADCQHVAAEFVGVLSQRFPRPGLPALALTTDTSILTSSANDFGFESVFERQVQALGAPGDVLIALSTSGNSPNVLKALGYARTHGIVTVGFTGASGGGMKELCDVCLQVPSDVTGFIQECHIMAGHIVSDLAERSLAAAGWIDHADSHEFRKIS